MNIYKRFTLAFAGMILVVLLGTFGFHYLEEISIFDALWMTVESLLTIGYGDFIPHETASKIFALFLIPLGIGVVTYTLGVFASMLIEGEVSRTVRRRRMEDKIQRLRNHVIICGYGRVGQNVADQLGAKNIPYVVVDKHVEALENTNFLYIAGDAADDDVLRKAGITSATGIVATLPLDSENVFVSLTAKGLNPNLQVVARAEKPESEEKLLRAGADRVINPSSIGGRKMAMSIIKPISLDFVDTILHDNLDAYSVEELLINAKSKLVHRSLAENGIRENYNVTVIAIKRNAQIISNPPSSELLLPGDYLIVFGSRIAMEQFDKIVS